MKNGKYFIEIIEDDDKLRNTLNDYFKAFGFDTVISSDGEDGRDVFYRNSHILDLIILDGMLPKLDGFDVLSDIRNISDIPVMMVTARESEEDHLKGYSNGADAYVTKPFLMSALKSQVIALIKRYRGNIVNIIEKGNLTVKRNSREVFWNGNNINTTYREFDLLLYLIENENIVLSREQILNSVWGAVYEGDERTVDTHIKQLRKKFSEDFNYIKSVYGVGYKFDTEEV